MNMFSRKIVLSFLLIALLVFMFASIKKQRSELAAKSVKMCALESRIKSLSRDTVKLHACIRDMQNAIDSLKLEGKKHTKLIKKLRDKMSRLKTEIADSRHLLKNKDNDIRDLINQLTISITQREYNENQLYEIKLRIAPRLSVILCDMPDVDFRNAYNKVAPYLPKICPKQFEELYSNKEYQALRKTAIRLNVSPEALYSYLIQTEKMDPKNVSVKKTKPMLSRIIDKDIFDWGGLFDIDPGSLERISAVARYKMSLN